MPLIFLITYAVLSQAIYTKSASAVERTSLVLRSQWALAFLLLFFFIVFANEEYSSMQKGYLDGSFALLAVAYSIIFAFYAYRYNDRLATNGYLARTGESSSKIESWTDTAYLAFVSIVAGLSLCLHVPNGSEIGLYFIDVLVLSATLYILWQKRFLRSRKGA